ncbi:MAG TPA: substrate-binding domain-containing protein [Geminicoccus sp.]|jgi:quinoprotein dehydrogenase-associated probable ABC transporter substrate-binding protein|uniref:substrate-binding domain-containing protein n=1 Tax=Geminicoccus sp. TaxID=2024832 RepID=UPI002E317297|nr:substrate-binding domain-containing protein [Geminicoccus sp.]HEX2528797.1 substrate-binding domain-containing protein [Geminicoccus sp.]
MLKTRFLARWVASLMLAAMAGTSLPSVVRAQEAGDLSLELIDPKVLRVCADPNNMPFSNEKQEGFENKIAELFARELGKEVAYTWFPQATGFVRNTLGAHKCDVIIGFPQGDEIVQNTNPYYRTVYALVFKPGNGLDEVETLSDERLKGKRIGVVAGTPPSDHLVRNGLMGRARPYPLMIDTRVDSSAKAMIADIEAGEIDAGVLWGPMAGFFAHQTETPLQVVPLIHEQGGPRLAYNITMGVRASDQEWKRLLNRMIRTNQQATDEILLGFDVPLLDRQNQVITSR